MQHNEFDYLFKVLIVGDCGVGKSALMTRFADDCYHECYLSTIGVDFKIRTIELLEYIDANDPHTVAMVAATKNKVAKFQVWDTAGQEKFRNIVSCYYRGAHGVILAYDTTDEASLDNAVRQWLPEIRKQIASAQVPILLVGTKADLVDSKKVPLEYAQRLAMAHNLPMPVETSAKQASNVELSFRILAHLIQRDLKCLLRKSDEKLSRLNEASTLVVNAEGNCSC